MDVANHPERNKLYNRLGSPNLPLIDIGGPVRLEPGDVAMLCSDGLWGALEEKVIVDRVTSPVGGARHPGHASNRRFKTPAKVPTTPQPSP